MKYDLRKIPAFGVAGNFTGHLEQAGEAVDFKNVVTKELNAPKAVFPTYIPEGGALTPDYLKVFPFDSKKIIFPKGELKLQIEPECAIIFEAVWEGETAVSLKPLAFGASNDCSIRKVGAGKISEKKNWGKCSKGISDNLIELDTFSKGGILDDYRIASFLVRDGIVNPYGEDSAVRDYSYIYEKLTDWIIDKLNNQPDEGPAEHINAYINESGCRDRILVSIGATRYTEYGEKNFLQDGDEAVVVLYPESCYGREDIVKLVECRDFSDKSVSVLCQRICM